MPHARPASHDVTAFARTWLAIALAIALGVSLSPGAAAAEGPPDQVDPPAPGEGDYLDDPSDPEPEEGARAFAAQPSPRYSLTGTRFGARDVVEIAGGNRFRTAVAASVSGWPNGSGAAVLATGEAHADALSGAVLAGVTGSPLLLTPNARLDDDVAAELRRLTPDRVFVIGQLNGAVEDAVVALGLETERIGGFDPYATSHAVARRAAELGAVTSTVLVASGAAFPDALSASALAAGLRHPILLAPPSGGRKVLAEVVAELGASRTWVIGGTAAIPEDTVAGLPGLERLSGPERTATAAVVAGRARAEGLTGSPIIASAGNYPDGLSGGVLAGLSRRGPLLLTHASELAPFTAGWLRDNPGSSRLDIMGGPGVISPLARCQAGAGDTAALICMEAELQRQGYNVGPVDGRLDSLSVWSFYAFQKAAGLRPTGDFDHHAYTQLLRNPRMTPVRPELGPNHVEIDIARQLVLVVRDGEVRHVLHTSTGKPSTPTIRGNFTVYEVRNVRQANRMYRPSFFRGGYAFHGYPEIPLHPASAGCARLYDGDMDFLWQFVQVGTRVATY